MNQIDKILPSKEEVDELFNDKSRVYIVDGTYMRLTDIELEALLAVSVKASDSAMLFKNSFDRTSDDPFEDDQPKKKNIYFKNPSVPSNKRRFGK